jgi:hypothetical protein
MNPNDTIITTDNATWWTPTGWSRSPEPEAYANMTGTGDWEDLLKAAGYKYHANYGGEFSEISVQIYYHASWDHLLVDLSNQNGGLASFFVASEHIGAFFATWYVQFLRDAAAPAILKSLEQIAETLTAFVRYGHGEDTIDEYGEMDYDDELKFRLKREAKEKAS